MIGRQEEKGVLFSSPLVRGWLIAIIILAAVLSLPLYAAANLWYYETKGPFKNWTQVVDLEGDGDRDVIVSHTRWEDLDISWAGIGIWLNQGNGAFKLTRDRGTGDYPFGGFAAGAVDVDQDGDLDVFTQDFGIHLLVNRGGRQGGESGEFKQLGGINTPPAYNQGYRDMGGTITMGDLNNDGRVDAFVAGCCYGQNAREAGYDGSNAPSVSWVWINDGTAGALQKGHILPMDSLDGIPIRQAALGDLDADGDLDAFAAVGAPTMGTTDSLNDLILLNDGTGKLTAFDQLLGDTDSTSVALGDVNGDGRLDALAGTSEGARLWINQGVEAGSGEAIFTPADGSFKAERTAWEELQGGFSAVAERLLGLYLPYGRTRTKAMFLEDLDGDTDRDALIARLWWNDGQGEFSRSDTRFAYPEDTGVAVADFDGDGDEDIFAGGNGENYKAWLNDGPGTFKEILNESWINKVRLVLELPAELFIP